tara:strand:+ start:106 stop:537 length:432 start_codon:yes stop_codon:yes gene_type:complete
MTTDKKIVICDIDGTVANNDHRQHLLKGFKTWDLFFNALDKDTPILEVIEYVLKLYSNGKKIVFITGRPERFRKPTLRWLSRYFDFELNVFMRGNNDIRHKKLVKKDIFTNNFNSEQIYIAIENDLELIDLWKSLGLQVKEIN